jgi:hypothetical protein
MVFAVTMLSVQAGYCGGTAWNSLDEMGGKKDISIASQISPVKIDNVTGQKTEKTPFEEFRKLFNEGGPATKADLTGWYAGRAVSSQHPTELEPVLLVGKPAQGPSTNVVNVDKVFCYRVNNCKKNKNMFFFENMDPESVETVKKSYGLDRILEEVPFPSAGLIHIDGEDHSKTTTEYRKARGCVIKQELLFYSWNDKEAGIEYYEYYCRNVTPKG